jgi:hypothetical protein
VIRITVEATTRPPRLLERFGTDGMLADQIRRMLGAARLAVAFSSSPRDRAKPVRGLVEKVKAAMATFAGPMVRIRLPPAENPLRTQFRSGCRSADTQPSAPQSSDQGITFDEFRANIERNRRFESFFLQRRVERTGEIDDTLTPRMVRTHRNFARARRRVCETNQHRRRKP